MRIIGCDLHVSQQSIAMLDPETGETTETTLKHEGDTVRDFYAAVRKPVAVGIEATGLDSADVVRDVSEYSDLGLEAPPGFEPRIEVLQISSGC